MTAYYNEIDPYAAQWLRNLIAAGHIAAGDVDERDIRDVWPDDIRRFTQCHFFAGLGAWSYALRLAGWPDDRPVWTGSCPCQPFSGAGLAAGFADERHLWPSWHHLIRECEPGEIFGEQVASKDGLAWLDLVQADLEAENYTNAAVDLCAAGVGAPHIRQRSWFVAYANNTRLQRRVPGRADAGRESELGLDGRSSSTLRLDHAVSLGRHTWRDGGHREHDGGVSSTAGKNDRTGPTNGMWRDADWLLCRDGKWRAVESGTFPLANGAPARVGRLRAYGNAINPYAAKEVIAAYMECRP